MKILCLLPYQMKVPLASSVFLQNARLFLCHQLAGRIHIHSGCSHFASSVRPCPFFIWSSTERKACKNLVARKSFFLPERSKGPPTLYTFSCPQNHLCCSCVIKVSVSDMYKAEGNCYHGLYWGFLFHITSLEDMERAQVAKLRPKKKP